MKRVALLLATLAVATGAYGQQQSSLPFPPTTVISPANNQCLVYQTSTKTWVNGSCASGGGATVTGSPANGNLTFFSGAGTISSGNLSGDCSTSGTAVLTCTKINGVTAAPVATSGSASDLAAGTLAAARLPGGSSVLPVIGLQGTFSIDNYSPNANGTTDDSTALNAALTACSTAGGGKIVIGPHRYYIASNITVPSNCNIWSESTLVGNANPTNYQTIKNVILLNSANTITMATGSGWYNTTLLQSGINFNPSTTRDELNIVAAFAGTGLSTNSDVVVDHAAILGFATGIDTTPHGARDRFFNLNIDATVCINSNQNHDVTYYVAVECFSYLTSGSANTTVTYAISNVANNGSGLYRLTLTSATAVPVTGDTMWVSAVTGTQSANGKWTVTAIDSTHIDLQGSAAAGVAPTGNTTNLSFVVSGLSSLAGIGIGSTITGAGIPASTTVSYIWASQNAIVLSNAATATASGVTLTIADTAYASGGTIGLDASFRNGDGIVFTNSETSQVSNSFIKGHTNQVHISTGASWISLTNCVMESAQLLDPNSTGILIDGSSLGTSWVGGSTQGVYVPLKVNSTGSNPHSIVGMELNTGGAGAYLIEIDSGLVNITGNSTYAAAFPILVADAATTVNLTGNSFGSNVYFQTQTGTTKFSSIGNILSANAFNGNLNYAGNITLGRINATACGISGGCGVHILGSYSAAVAGVITMTNGGSGTPSAAVSTAYFHATSTISSYTITLPSTVTTQGNIYNLYFDAAVQSLTWSGGANIGAPASVPANAWVLCQLSATSGSYLCGVASAGPTIRAVNIGTASDTVAAGIAATYESANTAAGAFTITLAAPTQNGERRRVCFKNATGAITWSVTAPATATDGLPATMLAGDCTELVYNSVSGTPTNAPATTWLPY
jgi:hypothetical protein